jgi:leucyl aminopeptidase (aminopeptidase T)
MKIKEFYNRFEMRVQTSNHRLRRMKPHHLRTDVWNTHLSDELVWNLTEAAEEVECVDVTMPVDRLEELEKFLKHYERAEDEWRKHISKTGELLAQHREDERVRIKNPAVRQAWEHYLTLLNLCRD